jgi:secreted trypsin-like serine protease
LGFKFGLKALGLFLTAALPAFPIALQYDQVLTTGSGGFPAVVRVGGCSGALLADGIHVLTAAHCTASYSSPDNINTVFTDFVGLTVGIFTQSTSVSIPVAAIHRNPLASLIFPSDSTSGLLLYDLAILDLATPAPADANGYTFDTSGTAIATNGAVTLAGWGLGGYPGTTAQSPGSLRAATNTVAGVFTSIIDPNATPTTESLPDTPIALLWDTTSDIHNPADTTGLGNHGDSGGPLVYNNNLIGVLAFGNLPDSGGPILVGAEYANAYTNLANRGNLDFLNSVLSVPEPGTWAMLSCGVLLLGIARRRRLMQ